MNTPSDSAPQARTQSLARQYHEDGFLILREVFDRVEMAAMDAEAARVFQLRDLIDQDNIRCRWQNCARTGECRFDCFDPITDLSPVFARVARDDRILSAMAEIYGEQAFLFKDKLIFKPPGATGYALHQDYISWKTFPASFATVMVAIDPASSSNGATEVFPGYHQCGCLTPQDGMYHELPAAAVEAAQAVTLELQPGDIAIFTGFTPHRSGPNLSDQWRRLLYLSYNKASDGGEQREQHYAEFHRWLKDRYAEYGKTHTFFR